MLQIAANGCRSNRIITAQRFEAQAHEAQQQADLIRTALFQNQLPAMAVPDKTNQASNSGQLEKDTTLKVVVLAAADGGLNALSYILAAFGLNFPAAIIVVQQIDSQSDPSLMVDLLKHPMSLPLLQGEIASTIKNWVMNEPSG